MPERRKRAPRPALVGRGYVGFVHLVGDPNSACDPPIGAMLTFEGLVTTNELNDRETKQRGKGGLGPVQRTVVEAGVRDWLRDRKWRLPPIPLVVTLTRVAPSQGLDTDGLAASLKRCRDAVSKALNIDDGPDSPIRWVPDQRRGPYAVEVRIKWGGR